MEPLQQIRKIKTGQTSFGLCIGSPHLECRMLQQMNTHLRLALTLSHPIAYGLPYPVSMIEGLGTAF